MEWVLTVITCSLTSSVCGMVGCVDRNQPDPEDDGDVGQEPGEGTTAEAGAVSQPGEQPQQ